MVKKCFYLLILVVGFSACYYDKEEELYPSDPNQCDTASATYSKTVKPLLEAQCYVCHSQAAAQGNIVLEGFDKLKIHVNNGRFFNAINHAPGFSPMPKNEKKLPDCTVRKIKAWIDKGAQNN